MDFREADRHYAGVKRQSEDGTITDKEFDEPLGQLIVEGEEGGGELSRAAPEIGTIIHERRR
jgi:hypothetical protein